MELEEEKTPIWEEKETEWDQPTLWENKYTGVQVHGARPLDVWEPCRMEDGRTYFFNAFTQESSWAPPPGLEFNLTHPISASERITTFGSKTMPLLDSNGAIEAIVSVIENDVLVTEKQEQEREVEAYIISAKRKQKQWINTVHNHKGKLRKLKQRLREKQKELVLFQKQASQRKALARQAMPTKDVYGGPKRIGGGDNRDKRKLGSTAQARGKRNRSKVNENLFPEVEASAMNVFKSMDMFFDFNEVELKRLCSYRNQSGALRGAIFYSQGETMNDFYVITGGYVEVVYNPNKLVPVKRFGNNLSTRLVDRASVRRLPVNQSGLSNSDEGKEEEKVVQILTKGDHFGSMSPADKSIAPYTYRCMSRVTFVKVSASILQDSFEKMRRHNEINEIISINTINKSKASLEDMAVPLRRNLSAIKHEVLEQVSMDTTQTKDFELEVESLTEYISGIGKPFLTMDLKKYSDIQMAVLNGILMLAASYAPFSNKDDIVRRAAMASRWVTNATSVNVFLRSAQQGEDSLVAMLYDRKQEKFIAPSMEYGPISVAFKNNKAVLVNSEDELGEYFNLANPVENEAYRKMIDNGLASLLCVPILSPEGDPVAVIRLIHLKARNINGKNKKRRKFNGLDLFRMHAISAQVTKALRTNFFEDEACYPSDLFTGQKFTITITSFSLSLDHVNSKKRSMSKDSGRKKAVKVERILLMFYVLHGSDLICNPLARECFIEVLPSEPGFDIEIPGDLRFDIEIADLPRNARLVVSCYRVMKDKGLNLFSFLTKKTSEDYIGWLRTKLGRKDTNAGWSGLHAKSFYDNTKVSMMQKGFFLESLFQTLESQDDISCIGYGSKYLFGFEQKLVSGDCDLLFQYGRFSLLEIGKTAVVKEPHVGGSETIEIKVKKAVLPSNMRLRQADMFDVVYDDFPGNEEFKRVNNKQKNLGKLKQLRKDDIEETSARIVNPLDDLHEGDIEILRLSPELFIDNPLALGRYAQYVDFGSREEVLDLYEYMYRWNGLSDASVLEFLGPRYADPKLRSLAALTLMGISNEKLTLYMLQMVQCLRYERFTDNSLIRLLLSRAILKPNTVGFSFFWALTSQLDVFRRKEPDNNFLILRFEVYLLLFLRNYSCKVQLGHQRFVTHKLTKIHQSVYLTNSSDKKKRLRNLLEEVKFPDNFSLPHKTDIKLCGVDASKCKVMSSKKQPLFLCFKVASKQRKQAVKRTPQVAEVKKHYLALFKVGDDLRQDQLTLQIFSTINTLWRESGLDFRLSIYNVVATSFSSGYIEVVKDAHTVAELQHRAVGNRGMAFRRALAAPNEDVLERTLILDEDKVIKNYLPSLAGYCVITYILGIGDRHSDNIMITNDLKYLHIDFGHFLGNFKHKFGFKREENVGLDKQQIYPIEKFKLRKEFFNKCIEGYNVLREPGNTNLLVVLFLLMIAGQLPELRGASDLKWLKETLFRPGDKEAEDDLVKTIDTAVKGVRNQVNGVFHYYVHKK